MVGHPLKYKIRLINTVDFPLCKTDSHSLDTLPKGINTKKDIKTIPLNVVK